MPDFVGRLREQGLAIHHHLVVEGELGGDHSILLNGSRLDGASLSDEIDARLRDRRLAPDDLFLLNFTSGTTGLPKCVQHHQKRWMSFHEFAVAAGELNQSDVFMSVVPTPFGFGLWSSHFTPTILGVPTVLMPRFSADQAISLLERHRVTVLAAVTTQFIMMVNSPVLERHDLSSLRLLFTGGEPVPYQRAAAFEDRTGAPVLQFYGSNETGAVSRTTLRDPREKRLRTAGRVIPEMNVRLFDESGNDVTASGRGRPGCKGPTLSGGYYGDQTANAELIRRDGWMMLGDIVHVDDEGYLRVIGRAEDFIIRGGKNISGPAVEQEVSTHPAVAIAAAVSMPRRDLWRTRLRLRGAPAREIPGHRGPALPSRQPRRLEGDLAGAPRRRPRAAARLRREGGKDAAARGHRPTSFSGEASSGRARCRWRRQQRPRSSAGTERNGLS